MSRLRCGSVWKASHSDDAGCRILSCTGADATPCLAGWSRWNGAGAARRVAESGTVFPCLSGGLSLLERAIARLPGLAHAAPHRRWGVGGDDPAPAGGRDPHPPADGGVVRAFALGAHHPL